MTAVHLLAAVARRILVALALPAVLAGLWWWLPQDSGSIYWPPLDDVLRAFPDTWTPDRLDADVLASLRRLAAGYLLATACGIVLGVAIGSSPALRRFLEPVLEFLRAVPPPVLVPVVMLFAGIGDTMKAGVIALGCLWPILLNTVEGVRAVDPVMAETARAYGLTGRRRLTSLVVPSALPQIFAGLRQALSIGLILMVISEMFAARDGLGFAIVQFQRSFAIPGMWTGILLLGALGAVLAFLFSLLERRVLGWYHGQRSATRSS
jgi:ABC-type nitrate/sulfonate/bicarbonate transport system permease component